jgi:hypothetical protein
LIIGYSASVVDFFLIELYSVDVKEEVNSLLDENRRVLLDGGMLTLFLRDQVNDYYIDSVSLEAIDSKDEVSYLKNSRFLVERDKDIYTEYYNIFITDGYKIPVDLKSIDKMNDLLVFNMYFSNSLAVLIGLFLILKYNRLIFI